MSRIGPELTRKAVHIGMGGFALLLRWLTPAQALLCAGFAFVFNLFVLHRLTRRALLRDTERGAGFSWGIALYPAVVFSAVAVFHSRLELAAACWGLLAFGDGMATVAGVLLRGPALPWNRAKSWAGFIGFVLYGTAASAFLIRWTQLGVLGPASDAGAVDWIGGSFLSSAASGPLGDPLFLLAGCLAASVAAALAESLETGIDDNVLVPLVGGATLFAATLVEPARLVAASGAMGQDLLRGAAINAVLALAAIAARGVGRSGAVWGWVLGTALYAFGGWRTFLMLLLFFVLGTATTRMGYAKKSALGIAQERGGRRGARNAFANTTTGVVFAFLAAATPHGAAFTLGAVAAFATAACDTVSSEIGQAFGRRHFLVTTLRPVRAGTDGAVSVEGTLAGILGAAVLACAAWATGLISGAGAAVVVAAAFVGATLESYLGATLERLQRIDNELVNFANTLVGALCASLVYVLMAGR